MPTRNRHTSPPERRTCGAGFVAAPSSSQLLRATFFALALLLGGGCAHAESEAGVKAAYLLNFAKFVEWPASAFSSAKAPLVIGIFGRDAVGEELLRASGGVSANGHPIEVRRIAAAEARECHLVFIPEAERGDAVVAAVQGSPVLVVGDGDGFARRGGALGFVKDGGSVKFEANPKAAARNGLNVSARLLRVARAVIEK